MNQQRRGEPIRVAVVAEPLWHRVPGGTGRATRALIDGLDRSPLTAVTVTSAWHRHSTVPAGIPERWRRWLAPRALLYELWARLGGRPGSRRVGDMSDIIHCPMIPCPRRAKTPLVVTVHDLAFIEEPAASPRRARRIYERCWRRICREADLVLCSSVATFAVATKNGLDPERARVVPLGATVPDVTPAEVEAVQRKFDLPRRYVLSVGTAEPRKNLPALLSAYAMSGLAADGVDLVLVGPVGWREHLGDRVAELDPAVESHVRLAGEVSDSDLHALYKSAVAFCYPSLLEGFGLPVLEAMAHGTAVVTSSTTSTAEIVGDAGVLVDPRHVGQIARALDRLVGDARRRSELGRLGRVRAEDFTWDRHIDLTIAAYREVLG